MEEQSFKSMLQQFELDIVEKFEQSNNNPNVAAKQVFIVTDEQVKQLFEQFKQQLKKGTEGMDLYEGLVKLYISLIKRRQEILNDRQKKNTDTYIFDVLKLMYLHFKNSEDAQVINYSVEVAQLLYEMETSEGYPKFEEFVEILNQELKTEFPEVKKIKQVVLKAENELYQEALTVKKILDLTPIIPEKEGELYHIVSIDWFQKWKQYTGYSKVKTLDETPGGNDDQSVTTMDDDNQMSDQFGKISITHNETPGEVTTEPKHPGPINEGEHFDSLLIDDPFLKHPQQPWDNFHIRLTCKEDEDFVIFPNEAWKFLFNIYGGNDLPRYSIELDSEDNSETSKKQYMIEIFYKKLQIYMLPKVRHHLSLKKPSGVFITRKATIKDYRRKVAEILNDNKKDQTIEDLMSLSRLWRLEIGENVMDIEKYYEYESKESLPIQLRGRIMDDQEIVDNINVADTDILLYEIQLQGLYYLKSNNMFPFIPRQAAEKDRKTKNSLLKDLNQEQNNEEYLMSMPLAKCLEQNQKAKGGLTGLQNLGNTCFMNSVIQCLSNTEPLAKFFLFDCYANHINERNPLGTRGKLAIAFSELLQELYVGDSNYTAPWDVKNIISRRAIQFQGFAQHDSQEMLSFLLETLHEDLNDVGQKPYVEYKDSEGRKDEEVSLEYWEGFRKREKSLFIDLFYGQLKSRVQCTVCNKISISFDPFNMLSLPIPINKDFKLQIKFFPYTLDQQPKEFIINVGEFVTLSEIKQKLIDSLSPDSVKQPPFIGKVKNKNVIELLSKEKFIKSVLDKGDEICAYERPHIPEHTLENFFLVELKINQHKRSWYVFSGVQPISYSRLFIFDRRMSVRDIKIQIFKFFRPLIKAPEYNQNQLDQRKFFSQERLLEEDYKYYFENKTNQSNQYESGNPLYSIFINNNLPFDQGFITSSQVQCDFCSKYHKGSNCPFEFKDNPSMKSVLGKMQNDRDFELVIQWNSAPQANLKQIENIEFEQVNLSGYSQLKSSNKGSVSLYDCVSWFSQEETLTGNDKWYCSNCKTHQNALKKMEIFRSPEYLILHLKRFSHQRQSIFSSRKIQDLIDFPVEGLDLSQYVLQEGENQDLYDLYAVSNHYGSLNGGHYTAFCQNQINNKWYEFDDSEVSKVDSHQSVTKAAYVLFYKRRQTKQ